MVVVVGMTKREVRRALGEPGARMRSKDFFKAYGTVVNLGGRMAREDNWMYHGYPPGHSTMITFRGRRVVKVVTQPTG